MALFATPGLYRQTVEPAYRAGPLARGDVAVLLGYAARGPVAAPVRLQSLSQFQDVFGPALPGGYLWHGVKGFFECGGVAAYVIRVADGTGRPARAVLTAPGADPARAWVAEASFPWPMVDPARSNRPGRADLAVWQALVDARLRAQLRQPDPGTWANGLDLTLRPAALCATQGRVEDAFVTLGQGTGPVLRLDSLAGLDPASVVDLSLPEGPGPTGPQRRRVLQLDPSRRRIRLDGPPLPHGAQVLLRSVEFDLELRRGGLVIERFRGLAPDPAHARALTTVLPRECRALTLIPPPALPGVPTDWAADAAHPGLGTHVLTGGTEGLAKVDGASWRLALAQVSSLSDAALIAAPDLVRRDDLPDLPAPDVPLPGRPCSDLSPRPLGFLSGQVRDGATGQPLAKVTIDVAGSDIGATTDADGVFRLAGVPLTPIDLRLSLPGYVPQDLPGQPSPFDGLATVQASMVALTRLPVLDPQTRLTLQQSMGDPGLVGPWKVALLDPPGDLADEGDLRAFAAQLGPDPRLALFAPWIQVPDAGLAGARSATLAAGPLDMPASGHVAGLFAQAELSGGIFRNGANLALRYADGVTLPIDDAVQAGLNPLGVNAIRAFPGRGIRVFGARSLAVGTEWQYLSARRIVDAIEKTLQTALAQLVFEPNAPFLRHAAQALTQGLLDRLWRDGHLAGDTPAAAYRVTCDDGNNTPDGIAQGQMVLDVAVAPVAPFEFIVFRINHAFDAVTVTEVGP